MSGPSDRLEPARLDWRDGAPYSEAFADIYYSSTDGRREVEHVFVAGNRLRERWAAGASGGFAIGETGFGTGLNFLVAAKLWLALVPAPGVLHYLSADKHPLLRPDLERVLALRGDDAGLAVELLAAWPPPLPGNHRLPLAGGRVQLTLCFGDAAEQFAAARCAQQPGFEHDASRGVDAWFLDGFAPARNPQMWTAELFIQLAALSRPGTSFATFTAAGAVRRGLAAAGFEVARTAGHGAKREMLCGRFCGTPTAPHGHRRRHGETPWDLGAEGHHQRPKIAAVVGAGIAGCTTARALAERGWRVRVFDRDGIAAGASGNTQGIVYPRLATADSAFARINLAALLYARNFYRTHWDTGLGADGGVLMLPGEPDEADQLRQLATGFPAEVARLLEGEALAAAAGIDLDARCGLLLPGLGWLQPAAVCRALLDHPRIAFTRANVTDCARLPDGWQLRAADNRSDARFPVLVLAAAAGLRDLAATAHLPLRTLHGQITHCPETSASAALRLAICGAGHVAPALHGYHSLGSTYRPDSTALAADVDGHRSNLAKLHATDAGLAAALGDPDPDQLSGRAGLRCVTPDHLPLVGPAPRLEEFLEALAPLRRDARTAVPQTGRYWPGLYVNAGHGSRGLAYAPLCAALVADLIEGRPRLLARAQVRALNPARFLVRDLQRRRR